MGLGGDLALTLTGEDGYFRRPPKNERLLENGWSKKIII